MFLAQVITVCLFQGIKFGGVTSYSKCQVECDTMSSEYSYVGQHPSLPVKLLSVQVWSPQCSPNSQILHLPGEDAAQDCGCHFVANQTCECVKGFSLFLLADLKLHVSLLLLGLLPSVFVQTAELPIMHSLHVFDILELKVIPFKFVLCVELTL